MKKWHNNRMEFFFPTIYMNHHTLFVFCLRIETLSFKNINNLDTLYASIRMRIQKTLQNYNFFLNMQIFIKENTQKVYLFSYNQKNKFFSKEHH